MEDIDFTNYEYAYDRVLELANCLNEKQNLIDNGFDLNTLFDSNFDQLRLVTSNVGAAVRLSKIIEKYREQYEEKVHTFIVVQTDEKNDTVRERLSKKKFIPIYLLNLHVPEVVKASDKKRIYTDIANFVNQYTPTVRRGELDGICAYAIAKYPQLCENEYSGYEIMKIKVLNALKNRRNNKRKKTE